MAEEAGILEFYNYVYTPFTQCVHSTWYHVGRYNSWPSESPLTRQLWMPCISDAKTDIWHLDLAAKYLDKSFSLFDEKALHRTPSSDIQDWIHKEIHTRFTSADAPSAEPPSDTSSSPNRTASESSEYATQKAASKTLGRGRFRVQLRPKSRFM